MNAYSILWIIRWMVLLERRPEYRNSGVAYQRESNHWHHVFNIQAGRMSAFREDVDDFVAWANTEADRSGWPAGWRDFEFTESGPAPRRIYHDYLDSRLAEAVREAAEGVTLVEADGEAVDVEVFDGYARVVVENGAGHYQFSHALVRDTIYSLMTSTRRARLHHRVG